ncbi:hypothetical protein [Phyllobacterium leguminum]|uniref:Uncharacterized protein n=1 Tax=Phyllobacterium leguminum TaxID=314237 RepID=A0A318T8J3_9HYPH|nr:hypothetical protein [Phyllobacterium leguminum]PYE89631.1 hypothetical protein C7477_103139 [Phyllobacterium leguminum]
MAVIYTVTDSTGVVHTRRSAGHTEPRYTHAVCAVPGSTRKNHVSYAGSYDLAMKSLADWKKTVAGQNAELREVSALVK